MKDYEGIIDASKTSLKAKQLAAQLIPRFFKFFPNLSSRALNAHFDLIEEEDLAVSSYIIYAVFTIILLFFKFIFLFTIFGY